MIVSTCSMCVHVRVINTLGVMNYVCAMSCSCGFATLNQCRLLPDHVPVVNDRSFNCLLSHSHQPVLSAVFSHGHTARAQFQYQKANTLSQL